MGEAALLIAYEQRIDNTINDRILATSDLLRAQGLDGVLDIVPAYCSILIAFDPLLSSYQYIASALHPLTPATGSRNQRKRSHHVVPVRYGGDDGPDLSAFASAVKLTVEEVTKLHSGRDYRVYFLGFMPGFAYMGSVPRPIAHPRHATPRAGVPAGSVGIAGEQTGVYPFASPGGWQIIGSTDVQTWDVARSEPALFAPGDLVRFEPTGRVLEPHPFTAVSYAPSNPVFEVLQAAPGSLVMDLGRPGYAHLGLSAGGAMDVPAATRVNALVGNNRNAAVLEMAHSGPTLRALQTTVIALDGEDLHCSVGTQRIPLRTSWLVRAGASITFRGVQQPTGGLRGYLALAGGFDVPPVLGSRSTYLAGGFGGLSGRPLRTGDILGGGDAGHVAGRAGRLWTRPVSSLTAEVQPLRYIPFEGPNSVPNMVHAQFESQDWRISDRSNRMGLRLMPEQAPLETAGLSEALSFGIVRGAIQLPPDGHPFLLAADHQTTGGYPLIGVVIMADWPVVAQLSPEACVRFQLITPEDAIAALTQDERELQRGMSTG